MGWAETVRDAIEATKDPKRRVAVVMMSVVALLALLAWLFAPDVRAAFPSAEKTKTVEATHELQGLVLSATDGRAVSSAHVKAVFDSSQQDAYTDSTGAFHLQVPSSVVQVRVYVEASRFRSEDVGVDLRQQSTLEIRLKPEKNQSSSGSRKVQGRPSTSAVVGLPPMTNSPPYSSSSPAPQPSQPVCVGSNCIFGTVNGNTSVTNVYGASSPPPEAFFSETMVLNAVSPFGSDQVQNVYGFTFKEHGAIDHPGKEVRISLRRSFKDPAFQISCEKDCSISQVLLVNSDDRGNANVRPVPTEVLGPATDGRVRTIAPDLPSDVMHPYQSLLVHIRSADAESPNIASVVSVNRPA